jgi:hypothetical protein
MSNQLDLAILEEFLAARGKRGEFTGDRLALWGLDAYGAVVNLRALGKGVAIESQKKAHATRFSLTVELARMRAEAVADEVIEIDGLPQGNKQTKATDRPEGTSVPPRHMVIYEHQTKGQKVAKQAVEANPATKEATLGPLANPVVAIDQSVGSGSIPTLKTRETGGGLRQTNGGIAGTPLIQSQKKCDKGAISEAELAHRMGVAREYIRRLRTKHLTEGTDWLLSGRSVLLTDVGSQEILRNDGVEPGDVQPEVPPILVEVIKFWRNPDLLGRVRVETDKPKDATILSVWVRAAILFRKGQQIPIKRHNDRWVLAMRQPRTKGKLK